MHFNGFIASSAAVKWRTLRMVRVKGGMSSRNDTLHDLWKGITMRDVINAE